MSQKTEYLTNIVNKGYCDKTCDECPYQGVEFPTLYCNLLEIPREVAHKYQIENIDFAKEELRALL